jgi:isopenicillin N synthase-like dioxygenase
LHLQEHFDQGSEYDTEHPNKWPGAPELAGFRSFMTTFFQQCDDVCLTLMKALELAWGVDDSSLVARCKPSATDLRLTHYPAIAVEEMTEEKKTCRIAPHTDFGPITLLFQDGTGGLEVQDRATGSFIPVNPGDTTEMIINVGDTLNRWTNGKILGGVHQVTVPESIKGKRDVIIPSRISMAYLFKAGRGVSLGPLPKFVSASNPAQFSDMTSGEYQSWRNSVIYNLDEKLYTKDGKKIGAIVTSVRARIPPL